MIHNCFKLKFRNSRAPRPTKSPESHAAITFLFIVPKIFVTNKKSDCSLVPPRQLVSRAIGLCERP